LEAEVVGVGGHQPELCVGIQIECKLQVLGLDALAMAGDGKVLPCASSVRTLPLEAVVGLALEVGVDGAVWILFFDDRCECKPGRLLIFFDFNRCFSAVAELLDRCQNRFLEAEVIGV